MVDNIHLLKMIQQSNLQIIFHWRDQATQVEDNALNIYKNFALQNLHWGMLALGHKWKTICYLAWNLLHTLDYP